MDPENEEKMNAAIAEVIRGKTVIVIAHRLSTIQDADMIVVMDHGQVVETGNHQQLLEKQGAYYALYMAQFAGNRT